MAHSRRSESTCSQKKGEHGHVVVAVPETMSKNSEDQGGGSPWIRAAQIYIKESPDYDKSVLAASEFKRRGIYAVWNPGLRIEYPLTSRLGYAGHVYRDTVGTKRILT